jgi:outer membrane protein assembly factor BamB
MKVQPAVTLTSLGNAFSTMRLPLVALLAFLIPAVDAADWPEIRGPRRDGTSIEKNLPEKWSPDGENLLWKVPIGGRSTPVILGDRLYALVPTGKDETVQERLICLDAKTGKLLWDYKWNLYHSDVPPHRIAWSSPTGDPETGNIYVYGAGATLLALTRDGKMLWEFPMTERFGMVTTHGGRTVSPVIDGDLVIVSGVNSGWGATARAGHRFFAFDKRTGDCVWVSSPGSQPFDTTYSPPVIATVDGTRLLIAGAGDGAVHAIKAATGEPVWNFPMSKRGINTGVALFQDLVFVSHGEENLDTSEMGLLAAIDVKSKGTVKLDQAKWRNIGFLGGYSTGVGDGQRVYWIDNGSNLVAFDAQSGKEIWKQNLGTIQRASLVFADGKLYVGNENGRFFVMRPKADGVDILSRVQLGSQSEIEEITASAAVANGVVFVVSHLNMYAFGKWNPSATSAAPTKPEKGTGKPAWIEVSPTELLLKPGATAQLRARLFDEKGNFLREEKAEWSLEGLAGTIDGNGKLTAGKLPSAGTIKAAAAGITGSATARVAPVIPIGHDFQSLDPGPPPRYWINATGKYSVRDMEGDKVLVKHADNAFTKRARVFIGHPDEHDYTVESRVRATTRRRQMGDAGVVAQRYVLTLFGNKQSLELQPWQPATARTVRIAYKWKPDTWYRLKLRVDNLPDNKTRARGKVWEDGQAEPDAWNIDHTDAVPNRQGSPGIYADAPFEVFLDDIKVTKNE